MSKCMVKLRPIQQKVRPFRHPLLDNADAALAADDVEALVESLLNGDTKAREKLILGHLSMLRHTIGRYLYHWPLTRRFCNEMVSAGLYAIIHALNRLEKQMLNDKSLGQYLLNHICKHIELEVARLRGIAPAPPRTNMQLIKDGKEPIFGDVEAGIESPKVQDGYAYIETRFDEFDTLDAITVLQKAVTHQLERDLLLNEELWGLSDKEIAKKLGVPRRTVGWHRLRLLKRYYEIIGD